MEDFASVLDAEFLLALYMEHLKKFNFGHDEVQAIANVCRKVEREVTAKLCGTSDRNT
jgi:hypothetical protein